MSEQRPYQQPQDYRRLPSRLSGQERSGDARRGPSQYQPATAPQQHLEGQIRGRGDRDGSEASTHNSNYRPWTSSSWTEREAGQMLEDASTAQIEDGYSGDEADDGYITSLRAGRAPRSRSPGKYNRRGQWIDRMPALSNRAPLAAPAQQQRPIGYERQVRNSSSLDPDGAQPINPDGRYRDPVPQAPRSLIPERGHRSQPNSQAEGGYSHFVNARPDNHRYSGREEYTPQPSQYEEPLQNASPPYMTNSLVPYSQAPRRPETYTQNAPPPPITMSSYTEASRFQDPRQHGAYRAGSMMWSQQEPRQQQGYM